ncbi:MAG: NAD(P)/FAD-dependent oxidoreductase [Bacilli bacterium]|jgi:thioredoxin reductase
MTKRFIHPLIIIGGGPAGLLAATKASNLHIKGLLLEGSTKLGGQVAQLYPAKEVVDLPISPILGHEYVSHLLMEYEKTPKTIKLRTHVKIEAITPCENFVELQSNSEIFYAKNIIIATGLGAYIPRKMNIPNDNLPEIVYALEDYAPFENKRILVLGGGDSALDSAKMLHRFGALVTIIHRREEFRGNEETIKDLDIVIKKPYVPISVNEKGGHVIGLTIERVDTKEREILPTDYIFVNFGFQPSKNTFNFKQLGPGIKVDENYAVAPNIFVIGDAASYPHKLRRIQPIYHEIERVFALISF